ncbi:hypothetical protein BVC80_8697g18 [Macleaya cordata]|uniref:Uncharacterized protein n=1 Tax=Macleaya cordata TaxID=56857 RepID=A0A200Q0D3_MACCD|nr:hypothetical protein BVC80_8697g18 [Macleaya cordata]
MKLENEVDYVKFCGMIPNGNIIELVNPSIRRRNVLLGVRRCLSDPIEEKIPKLCGSLGDEKDSVYFGRHWSIQIVNVNGTLREIRDDRFKDDIFCVSTDDEVDDESDDDDEPSFLNKMKGYAVMFS